MKTLKRQDRNGSRKASDIEQKYKLGQIDYTAEEIEELKKKVVVDSSLSTTSSNAIANSVVTTALNTKVTKETGKGLSSNDFTDTYKSNLDKATTNNHSHNNKAILDKITQSLLDDSHTHSNKDILDSLTQAIITNSHTHSNKAILDKITQTYLDNWNKAATNINYDLSSYKADELTILRSSCRVKNNRVVINFVGTMSMAANTTTTLFTLPEAIRPTTTRDFVAFGQSSNTDGYVGYGYVTETGLLQVRFNAAISSYIRFSFTYDLE